MSKRDNATGKEGTGKREYKNGEKGKEKANHPTEHEHAPWHLTNQSIV